MRSYQGFTLIEILLVVVIIAALSAMVIPRFVGRSEQAKVGVAKSDIEAHLATALKLYELDNGNFPTTNQGLKALMTKSSSSPIPKNWNGPYIERSPTIPGEGRMFTIPPGLTDWILTSTQKARMNQAKKMISSIGNRKSLKPGKPLKSRNGFSFIEVMVATIILSAGIVSIYKTYFVSLDAMSPYRGASRSWFQ